MRILSKSLALRDTYGAKVLLATRDGAVLCQKASEGVPQRKALSMAQRF